MMRLRLPVAAVSLSVAISCSIASARPSDPLAGLAWLAGCWAVEGGEAGSVELWTTPAGGTMLGVARTVRGGKTVGIDFMQIRAHPDSAVVLVARPSGQAEATFTAVSIGLDQVTFENPTHDFPQKISYRKTGPRTVLARIEGVRNGAMRRIDFPMRRSVCEGER